MPIIKPMTIPNNQAMGKAARYPETNTVAKQVNRQLTKVGNVMDRKLYRKANPNRNMINNQEKKVIANET